MLFVYPPDNTKSTVYYVMQHLKSLLPKVVVKVQQSVSTITHFLIVWFLALNDVCGDNAILREGMLAPIVNWHSAIHTVGMDTIVLLFKAVSSTQLLNTSCECVFGNTQDIRNIHNSVYA